MRYNNIKYEKRFAYIKPEKPRRPARKGIFTKYRKFMSKLKEGDSFIIPISDWNNVYGAANILGINITGRILDSSTKQVWRIKNAKAQI